MKITQQVKLQHPKQSSKTLTITIYKSDNERFVVKYFYSINNTPKEEYNKTEVPVNAAQAQLIFDNLVNYKLQKGYFYTQKSDKNNLTALPNEKREQQDKVILSYLKLAAADAYEGSWKLSRIIWRAGELKIKAAVPYLLQLSNPADEVYQYSLIWTLGRLEDERALPLLEEIHNENKNQTILKNITREALANIYQGEARQAFLNQLKSELPQSLNQNLITSDCSLTLEWLRKNITSNHSSTNHNAQKTNFLLPLLYTISKEHNLLRQALLTFIQEVSLKPKHFKGFRQIFKAAEFRQDGEMFGIIAYRLEKETENYKSSANYVHIDNRYEKKSDAMKSGKLAYSDKTRGFLKRRVWRTLKRMGEARDTNYVKMAAGVLASYNDQTDLSPAYETSDWVFNNQTGRYHKRNYRFDTQSNFVNLYHILYSNSPRYTLPKGAKAWICDDDYSVGDAEPQVREEAFPALWNAQPLVLVELLSSSEAERVHDFATKVLRQHPQFEEIITNIDTATIVSFLQKPFSTTNELALRVAINRYDAQQPDLDLVEALMVSPLVAANEVAQDWILNNQQAFFENITFVKNLINSSNEWTQNWITTHFNSQFLNENKTKEIVERLLNAILQKTTIQHLTHFLQKYFDQELRTISLNWFKKLLNDTNRVHQVFAGELLQKHITPVEALPNELIEALLNADTAEVRQIGLSLLAKYTDATLLQKQEALITCSVSPLRDVRQLVLPILKRLAVIDAAFAENLMMQSVKILLKKETFEGLHQDTKALLTKGLAAYMERVPRKIIFRLLNSKYGNAQEVGILLVQKYVSTDSLSVRNIIRLANHEMLLARQTAWKMFNENMGRIRYERDEAIRLLDSTWEDTRAFAFDFFRKNYTESDWTPEILVGICDSVREDVQEFGREMLNQFFTEEKATDYLLKLSQHPSTKMQNFAAQYLHNFASDNLEMFQKLEFYCKIVLLKVNKGRTAKGLVFSFLHQEGIKSAAAAQIVIRILKRVSKTVAITDKAKCIEILRDIQLTYPELDNPLNIKKITEAVAA